MKKADRSAARAAMKEIDLDDVYPIVRARHGQYVCPICGSGLGKHKTGALMLYRDSHRVRCYANNCFGSKGEDTLGALRLITGLSETAVLEQYLPHNNRKRDENK